MANKIVLISDDFNFFDFIRAKLELRKSDELYTFEFDAIPERVHLLETAVLIVNSEGAQSKTLDLIKLFQGTPILIFSYNEDEVFKRKCFRAGIYDFMTPLTSDSDFRSRIIPALTMSGMLERSKQYRELLVRNNIVAKEKDVFLDYNYIIDKELEEINAYKKKAVFIAISPNEKVKFILNPSTLEAIILNNIRKNDILMNYAPNKYFLFIFDTNIEAAQKLWDKICSQFPQKIYAGFCNVSNQKRQQLINESLNKLHTAINSEKNIVLTNQIIENKLGDINSSGAQFSNFKMFRQGFEKKISQIITPVFYQIQQKYAEKFAGVTLEQGIGDGYGTFYIKDKYSSSCFRITSPGFSKINIDITYQKNFDTIDAKRIVLEPEELEAGLLGDLLEQFIAEYKKDRGNNV